MCVCGCVCVAYWRWSWQTNSRRRRLETETWTGRWTTECDETQQTATDRSSTSPLSRHNCICHTLSVCLSVLFVHARRLTRFQKSNGLVDYCWSQYHEVWKMRQACCFRTKRREWWKYWGRRMLKQMKLKVTKSTYCCCRHASAHGLMGVTLRD